jgi:hypothetical protein
LGGGAGLPAASDARPHRPRPYVSIHASPRTCRAASWLWILHYADCRFIPRRSAELLSRSDFRVADAA